MSKSGSAAGKSFLVTDLCPFPFVCLSRIILACGFGKLRSRGFELFLKILLFHRILAPRKELLKHSYMGTAIIQKVLDLLSSGWALDRAIYGHTSSLSKSTCQ
jgi:hypothetical protein